MPQEKYYREELALLRQQAKAQAKKNPHLAPFLQNPNSDPGNSQ